MLKVLFFFLLLPLYLLSYEISIVAIFQNEAPYLREWIEYHRLIGVDHFWLYNDNSKDDWNSVLQPYIDEGVVEFCDWSFGRKEGKSWFHIQTSAYKDGLKKALGKTRWVALIDADEFILPMQNRSLKECLEKHYKAASAIHITWRQFGTGGVYLKEGQSQLFHLINCAEKSYPDNAVGKTMLRVEDALIDTLNHVNFCPLKPGALYFDGDGNPIKMKGGEQEKPSLLRYRFIRDKKHHDKYVRINHYTFRDETYFQNVKLERKRRRGSSDEMTFHQYRNYSVDADFKIIDFLKLYYPEACRTIWGQ